MYENLPRQRERERERESCLKKSFKVVYKWKSSFEEISNISIYIGTTKHYDFETLFTACFV